VLQNAYIRDNPFPVGVKYEQPVAPGPHRYHSVHQTYHPFFRSFIESKGYYDVLLFDLHGNCVYSFAKNADFGTNLLSGLYASTDLGHVLREARLMPIGIHTTEFKPYEPMQGGLARFQSIAVLNSTSEALRGVIAILVPFEVTVQLDAIGDRIESCDPLYHCSIVCAGTGASVIVAGPSTLCSWADTAL
jgi:methyl-accepting chemotaxis protein